jgi:hypothetical protein
MTSCTTPTDGTDGGEDAASTAGQPFLQVGRAAELARRTDGEAARGQCTVLCCWPHRSILCWCFGGCSLVRPRPSPNKTTTKEERTTDGRARRLFCVSAIHATKRPTDQPRSLTQFFHHRYNLTYALALALSLSIYSWCLLKRLLCSQLKAFGPLCMPSWYSAIASRNLGIHNHSLTISFPVLRTPSHHTLKGQISYLSIGSNQR